VLLRNGETRDDVVVRMFRGGAIAGRVLDGYGDPVDNVEIRVLHARRGAGAEGPSRTVQTNDLGEYRVGQLRPGAYLVMAVRNSHTVDVPLDGARPLPQPLPTLYPSTPSPSEAVPLVVERGGTLTDVEITLVEGVPTIVTGTLISDDGRPLASDQRGGGVNARLVNRELPGLGWIGHGSAIRPDGTFQLTLAPGEYVVQAHLSGGEPDRPLMGLTRLVAGGEAMHVTIPVGRGATAAGRVVFDGATPAPPAGSDTRVGVPLQSPEGGECNSGRLQLSRDWTFKVEGLFGTCGAPSLGAYGRWMLKSVTIGGVDVTHSTVTFQSGEHYSDVQIVVTDRGAELNLAVTDEHGQVSRDYVGVVFPADRDRWREPFAAVRTYSPQPPEYVEMLRASGVVPMPPLREAKAPRQAVLGLAPGDYFAIALDDIDGESAHDPAVLERLASSAVRVSLVDGSSQVTLRRLRFADLMR
jgi:hypothetical protein